MAGLRPFLVVLAAASALGSAACKDPSTPPPVEEATFPDSADQVIFGGRTALAEGGLRRGELRFDTAYVYDQGRRFELRGVNATFYEQATGAQQGTLVGREGTYNTGTGIMEARGSVVVTRADGAVLRTPQLRYSSGPNEITSDSAFTFNEPSRGTVEGVGFVTDPSFNQLRILQTRRATGTQPVTLPNQ